MNETKIPKWLTDTQNKSWEPEILISGITLTFLFLLSNYIYNFYGMLIQDFAVWDGILRILYCLSIMGLNGFKIVFITHLILRGIWAGLVGISYVFPNGVNKQKLSKNDPIDYEKPETLVMNIERICSLLFSFIFTSISFVVGLFIIFIPVILLFIIGLDVTYIRFFMIYIFVPAAFLFGIVSILFGKYIIKLKLMKKIEGSLLFNILKIYLTNIGKIKTIMIFIVYFLIVYLISYSELSDFKFRNGKSVETASITDIYHINKNYYEDQRDNKYRITKSSINQFRVQKNSLDLFISFYKEDIYAIKELENNQQITEKYFIGNDSSKIKLPDLYQISIDDKIISELNWYMTENIHTDQKGLITTIPLDDIKSGFHEIKINKIYWSIKKEELLLIKNWDIIPFELNKEK